MDDRLTEALATLTEGRTVRVQKYRVRRTAGRYPGGTQYEYRLRLVVEDP